MPSGGKAHKEGTPVTQDESKSEAPKNPTAEYLGLPDARNLAVEGNDLDGYIGVSPEYMNYADETMRPFATEEERIPVAELRDIEDAASASDDSEKEAPEPVKATTTKPAPSASKTASSTKSTSTK